MAHLTETKPKTALSSNTISEQHEELKVLVTALPAIRDLPLLVTRLRELRDGLEAHFELEEGPNGFHDIVLEEAPRHHANVQRLFEEHREFLRRLDAIAFKARDCIENHAMEIYREVDAFARALEGHEARENEILGDAIYSDTGFAE